MLQRVLNSNYLLVILCLTLSGCVTETLRIVDMTPPAQFNGIQDEEELLDVGIAVFDPNIPEEYDEQIKKLILPDIRNAEANFIPYFSKNLLQSTGNWGAVRVVPRPTHAVDVTVSGKIIHSDGERLIVEVTVQDATGRTWFTKTYENLASKYAYEDTIPSDIDPFQRVYKNLADDMLAYRETLSTDDVINIRATAEMKFARDFAPDAFDSHVIANDDGAFELRRLPAEDDPMIQHVRKVRNREYLFIDTIDEYYENFYRNMRPSYQNWRKATYGEAIAYRKLRAQSRNRAIGGVVGIVSGVGAIYGSDSGYVDAGGLVGITAGAMLLKSAVTKRSEAQMHAQVLEEVGVASEANIMPYTIELENQTLRLTGTVDQQYEELRHILRTMYFEEMELEEPVYPADLDD